MSWYRLLGPEELQKKLEALNHREKELLDTIADIRIKRMLRKKQLDISDFRTDLNELSNKNLLRLEQKLIGKLRRTLVEKESIKKALQEKEANGRTGHHHRIGSP